MLASAAAAVAFVAALFFVAAAFPAAFDVAVASLLLADLASMGAQPELSLALLWQK